MKPYLQWILTEDYEVPNQNSALLDQSRKDCPQISDHDAMVDDMSRNGVRVYGESGVPRMFVPSQNEFDWKKVERMIGQIRNGEEMKPFVVSRDNVVIDGHHRWAAFHNADPVQPAKVCRVNLSYDQFCDFVRNKPYIKYKSL